MTMVGFNQNKKICGVDGENDNGNLLGEKINGGMGRGVTIMIERTKRVEARGSFTERVLTYI